MRRHVLAFWPVISPTRFEDVRRGDIVTFRREDKFPTYRVVRLGPSSLTLQGDNWPEAEFEAQARDVLGKAVARERHGGRLTDRSWSWRLVGFLRLATRRFRHRLNPIVRLLFSYEAARRSS